MNLLSIADLSRDDIEQIFKLTDEYLDPKKRAPLSVSTNVVGMLFFEDSTRTRVSFERASRRLNLEIISFSPSSSSMNKGESLSDTVRTIRATGANVLVMRHSDAGAPHQVARWVDATVVNAGDGWNEHPTQALLDCYTIREAKGDLEGLNILILGDIMHSRVARSNVRAFNLLGASVTLVAPPTLLPISIEGWPVTVSHDFDMALPKADVIYTLRMQKERQNRDYVPTLREYTSYYGLTEQRRDLMSRDAVIMHPGPMNIGVEISAEMAELPEALITRQVANGVAVRTGALAYLMGERP